MTIRSLSTKIDFFLKRFQFIDRQMAGRGERNPAGKDRGLIRGL